MKKIILIISSLIVIEMMSLPNISYGKTSHSFHKKDLSIPLSQTIKQNNSKSYLLNIRVDGKTYAHPFWVIIKNSNFFITAADAKKLNIHTHSLSNEINLSQLATVKIKYNPTYLTLDIKTPLKWLPTQQINPKKTLDHEVFYQPDVTDGVLLNYSIYALDNHLVKYLSAFINALYYNNYGYFIFSGQYNSDWIDGEKYIHFNRLNTSFILNDQAKAEQLILGDFQTGQSYGFNSVYMAGIQFRKNFSLRPDIVTYPTLKLTGTASVPSVLDLFVNGSNVKKDHISAGPYILNNIPFINGDGTITLVTTDQNGKKVVSTIPYYISTDQLKPGLNNFSFSLGTLRYNYGLANDYYKHLALSGTYSEGITDNFTITSHAEASQGLTLLGVGGLFNLNALGNISTSLQISHSHSKVGGEFYFSYNKNISNNSSISFTHNQNIGDFVNLSTFDSKNTTSTLSDEVFYSRDLGNDFGNIGVGLVYLHSQDNADTKILNLSYTTSIDNIVNVSLSYSHTIVSSNQNNIALQISIPFSGTNSVSEQFSSSLDNHYVNTLNISHNSPSVIPFGWNLIYSQNKGQKLKNGYKDFSGYWDNNVANLSGGIYGYDNFSSWLSAKGSIVFLNSHLFMTKPLNGSFIEIDTKGVPNVPFYYNNAYEGKTNSDGIAFISNVLPYNKSTISIDPSYLPENVVATQLKQSLFIPDNSGYVAKFNLNQITPLLVTIQTAHNLPLQTGNIVTDNNGNYVGMLGFGQQIYLKNTVKGETYKITNNAGQICHFQLPLDFQIFSSRNLTCY